MAQRSGKQLREIGSGQRKGLFTEFGEEGHWTGECGWKKKEEMLYVLL